MSRDFYYVHLHQGSWAEGWDLPGPPGITNPPGPSRGGAVLRSERVGLPGTCTQVATFEGWPETSSLCFLVTSYLDAMIPRIWPEADALQGNGLKG